MDFGFKKGDYKLRQIAILVSLVIPKEGNPLQRQHVLVIIRHLIVVLLPHVDEIVAVNEADELA